MSASLNGHDLTAPFDPKDPDDPAHLRLLYGVPAGVPGDRVREYVRLARQESETGRAYETALLRLRGSAAALGAGAPSPTVDRAALAASPGPSASGAVSIGTLAEPPPRRWTVAGLVPEGAPSILAGHSGLGRATSPCSCRSASAGVLFGTDTGAVSDSVPTGVTPAGWAFSVWSVIFVGVLVFAGWQARPAARGPRYDALAVPFVAANVLNGLWQVPWLARWFGVAAVVIVGIAASLAWLYVRLDRAGLSTADRWALGVPTSLFLGWVSVATALNVSVALAAAGWTGGALWPPLVVGLVAAVGAGLLRRTGDVALALVLAWAFAAVYAENGAVAPALTATLAAGVAAFAVATALALRGGASPLPVSR